MPSMIEFDIGVAVFSAYDADGWLGVQFDAEGEEESGVVPYEVQAPAGLLHRPLDPDTDSQSNVIPGKGSSLLLMFAEGLNRALVLTDPRVVPLLPILEKGETILYADGGSFIRLHEDGRISLYTTDTGDRSGQDVARTLGPTGFNDYGPWGSMAFDPYGFRVNYQPGASFTLGYLGGLISNLGTYAAIVADQVEIDASVISIGPQGAPQDQVAKLTALITLLEGLMSAVSAAITASGAPSASAAVTAFESAVSAALGAAPPLLGTQTLFG